MNPLNCATGHSKCNHIQLNMSVSVLPILSVHIRTDAALAVSRRTQLAAWTSIRMMHYFLRQTKLGLQDPTAWMWWLSIQGHEGIFRSANANTVVLQWLRWQQAKRVKKQKNTPIAWKSQLDQIYSLLTKISVSILSIRVWYCPMDNQKFRQGHTSPFPFPSPLWSSSVETATHTNPQWTRMDLEKMLRVSLSPCRETIQGSQWFNV